MSTSPVLLQNPNSFFPLLSGEGSISIHNPRAMASSTLKIAWTRLLRSWNGMPTRRWESLGCRSQRTISIWSCSLGRSIILATFALQRLTKEEIGSFGLCLVASYSCLDTLMSALKANRVRNSWATSSEVRSLKGSIEANHLWVGPLSNMGKRVTNYASSISYALMTVLYSLKWIWGQPIPL